MSTPAQTEPAPAAAAAAPAPRARMILIGVALLGVGLGGAVGKLVVAPWLVPQPGHAEAGAAESEGEPAGHGEGGGQGKIFSIENIIVNPAGSEGTRFLMASVAFQVEEPAAHDKLKSHETEIRDMIVSRLESVTLAMLTQPNSRDTLKAQLARAVRPLLGPKAKVRVFLPQFVIQ